MQCPSCSQEIAAAAKWCGYCGHKFEQVAPPPPPAPAIIKESVVREEKEETKKKVEPPIGKEKPTVPKVSAEQVPKEKPVAESTTLKEEPEFIPEPTHIFTPHAPQREKVLTQKRSAIPGQPPLALTILVTVIAWCLAQWIFSTFFIYQFDALVVYLALGILVGLAVGGVLWWSHATIKWHGALIILFGWVLYELTSFILYEVSSVELYTSTWLVIRALFPILPGIIVGWVMLRKKRPFPIGKMVMIGLGWMLAWFVGGLGNILLVEVTEFSWYVDYALAGSLGVWITLAITRQLE